MAGKVGASGGSAGVVWGGFPCADQGEDILLQMVRLEEVEELRGQGIGFCNQQRHEERR